MKKSLILLGMLSIGYAYAQSTDPYEGKVGINTNEPKATLDITPEANNLTGTTNEGIIAPRLTKTRIANIEASKLTEGTLVYATDAVYTAGADTAKNGRVAKINEKGYYFYNGTEWVKVQYKDSDTNDAEWVYDDTTKRINLKRSGQNTGFINKVYYDVQTGDFVNSDTDLPNTVKSNIYTSAKSSNIRKSNILWGDKKVYSYQNILIDNTDNNLGTGEFRQNIDLTTIEDGSPNTGLIMNRTNYVRKYDSNRTNQIFTEGNYAEVTKGTAREVYSLFNKADIGGTANITQAGAIKNYSYLNAKNGKLSQFYSINNEVSVVNAGVMDKLVGQVNLFQFLNGGSSTIKNLVGLEMLFPSYGNHQLSVENAYGLILPDLKIGTKSNYAIYSNAGKVRVGDLADTGATTDRVVTVDANGVLKAGGTIAANNGVQTQSSMTCTAENAGKINYTTIQKDGKDTGVFGFCMQKGTDYVWAYMLGGSNIYGTSANGAAFGDGL